MVQQGLLLKLKQYFEKSGLFWYYILEVTA